MAKPLPAPPSPPSGRATRLMRSIRELAEAEATTPEEYAQKVIDLQHIGAVAREPMDRLYYEAVRQSGTNTFRGLAARTGLSRAAVQKRVDNGDPTLPTTSTED